MSRLSSMQTSAEVVTQNEREQHRNDAEWQEKYNSPGKWVTNQEGETFWREYGTDYTDNTKSRVRTTREENLAQRWVSTPEQYKQYQQAKALKDQQKLDEQLRPFILESMGLKVDEATGQIRKITEEERFAKLSPEEREQRSRDAQLEALYKEHLTAAQEGRLPVSLQTQDTLKQQEGLLNENMSRRLGTNWKASTPGLINDANFNLSAEATREAERHDDMSTASNLLNNREGAISDLSARSMGLMQGLGSPSYQLAGAYGTATQPHLFDNLLKNRGEIQDSANNAANTADIYELGGAVAGAGAMGYANRTPTTKSPYGWGGNYQNKVQSPKGFGGYYYDDYYK